MIKGLYGVMMKLESVFAEAAGFYIHHEIQKFIQITIQEPLRKTGKKAGKALTRSYVRLKLINVLFRENLILTVVFLLYPCYTIRFS